MKFCLKGLLGDAQRQSFFKFLDVLALLCQDSIKVDDLPVIDKEVNLVLALLERDFPVSIQVNACQMTRHLISNDYLGWVSQFCLSLQRYSNNSSDYLTLTIK